jgi:hypothetical protein
MHFLTRDPNETYGFLTVFDRFPDRVKQAIRMECTAKWVFTTP